LSSFINSKNNIKSLAIGRFDGVHLAHQKLIELIKDDGGVLVIENNRAVLTPKEYKCKFIKLACFKYFLDDIKHLSGKEFINKIKNDFVNIQKIVVGYDFEFGYERSCKIAELKELFYGEVIVVDEIKYNGISVHSRFIKEFLRDGKLELANRLLNRNYMIAGEVQIGQGLGQKELFPTINLSISDFILPKDGVYATITYVNNRAYKSVTFIGVRNTDMKFAIESHLLDIKNIVIETQCIEIEFIKLIRENRKFSNLIELKEQIIDDLEKAKEIFIALTL